MTKQSLPLAPPGRAEPVQLDLAGPACCAPLAQVPLSSPQAAALAPMFKALGDPVRLRLLSMIASHGGDEVCVCDLTGGFEVSSPTISHHLRVLREAGMIDCERRGTWVYYWLRPGVLDQLAAVLQADRPAAAALDGREVVARGGR